MAIPQVVILLAAGIGGAVGGRANDRDGDPVVLSGQALATLGDASIDDVVGFRYESDWHQIPVQIDERKGVDFGTVYYGPDGSLVGLSTLAYADSTTYTGADPDPTFDPDDELVFMARERPAVGHPARDRSGSRKHRSLDLHQHHCLPLSR